MTIPEIPVLLLTGYLGSGKTTLLNRILQNERGIRFAVIVNDIGEVNIDADLIQKGGIVGQEDDSLVALQNGCICCSLKMDLVKQLADIIDMQRFDYIVIEASGICEPGPIAQTICSIPTLYPEMVMNGVPRLDSITTVVDALRLKDEFQGGQDFLHPEALDGDDLERLVIEQIEFCNKILLNKASEVTPEELERTTQVLHAIQPEAEIIPCDFCDVSLSLLLNTRLFDFDRVATSATWIREIERHEEHEHEEHHHHDHDHEHHDHEHEHEEHDHHHHEHGHDCHCHHCHHHDGEEHNHTEEYGIGTFVYQARRPMLMGLFDEFVARHWPKNIIRAKGICYFKGEDNLCYVFEQAGRQVSIREAGQWYAAMPREELIDFMEKHPDMMRDWDVEYGDRMQKLVFIGQHLDHKAIQEALDACLV